MLHVMRDVSTTTSSSCNCSEILHDLQLFPVIFIGVFDNSSSTGYRYRHTVASSLYDFDKRMHNFSIEREQVLRLFSLTVVV